MVFVCTENAGRSQLAAALLRCSAAQARQVHSAGTHPSDRIDPVARSVRNDLTERIDKLVQTRSGSSRQQLRVATKQPERRREMATTFEI
ncbi:arsenate-mycothiol transferase ArsC [Streptomyces sp. KR80]|uniref:arsenate-mycothiol transferase ArsC n=1 Tax=Streptomyces sp. KR80 TaxID=3457426 RepID=UPI003FD2DC0D